MSLRKCYYNNNLYDLKYLENEVRTMSSLDKQIDFTKTHARILLMSLQAVPDSGRRRSVCFS